MKSLSHQGYHRARSANGSSANPSASIEAACDGRAPGVIEMYQAYIDGKKELREINREYVAHYISGREGPTKSECGMF